MARPKRKQAQIEYKAHEPKHTDKPFLDNLPELCLHLIMDNLDIRTMGRVECWSKGWREWLEVPYHVRYIKHLKEEERRAQEQADRDDALWAEAFFNALSYPYITTPIRNWPEFVALQRKLGLPTD